MKSWYEASWSCLVVATLVCRFMCGFWNSLLENDSSAIADRSGLCTWLRTFVPLAARRGFGVLTPVQKSTVCMHLTRSVVEFTLLIGLLNSMVRGRVLGEAGYMDTIDAPDIRLSFATLMGMYICEFLYRSDLKLVTVAHHLCLMLNICYAIDVSLTDHVALRTGSIMLFFNGFEFAEHAAVAYYRLHCTQLRVCPKRAATAATTSIQFVDAGCILQDPHQQTYSLETTLTANSFACSPSPSSASSSSSFSVGDFSLLERAYFLCRVAFWQGIIVRTASTIFYVLFYSINFHGYTPVTRVIVGISALFWLPAQAYSSYILYMLQRKLQHLYTTAINDATSPLHAVV